MRWQITSCNYFAYILAALLLLPCAAGAQAPDVVVQGKPSGASAEPAESSVNVSVFYVTNRKRGENGPAADTYGGERGVPHFGRCDVVFTPIPVIDQIRSKLPFYVPSETRKVRITEQDDAGKYWDNLTAAIGRTSSGTAVVFVHGYSYGFERTCRMAAEMQRTLGDKATVLMFSWPSSGLPTNYVGDQADLEWSVPFLTSSLAQLGAHIGPSNVQVLAHSLGSRGVIFALEKLSADLSIRQVIGRLVLLAPDFDAQTFVDLLPKLVPLTGGITLYASSNDTPLKVSRQLNGHPRLGEAGEYLIVVKGLETIDVSPIGRRQILGHEYFYYHPQVTADIVLLLSDGLSAAERPALRPLDRNGIRYWEMIRASQP